MLLRELNAFYLAESYGQTYWSVRVLANPKTANGWWRAPHTVAQYTATDAAAIDASVVDYAIAGPAFETPSKPGYGPEIGRKGLAEIAAAARVPVLAIGGLNATRAAEVLAVGPVGIAVMGNVMRAADPGREVRGLLSVLAQARRAAAI